MIAQSLAAASLTVDDSMQAHFLSSTFLEPGAAELPLMYRVEPVRDGASSCVRLVRLFQEDKIIFMATIAFQLPSPGLEYAGEMLDVGPPETTITEQEHRAAEIALGKDVKWVTHPGFDPPFFEWRPLNPRSLAVPKPEDPRQAFWFRLKEQASTKTAHRLASLAFMSDMMMLSTTLLPHGVHFTTTPMAFASMNHSIWFHRDPPLEDWMLYAMEASWTGGGRGLARASLYGRSGELVATTAQEGMIKVR